MLELGKDNMTKRNLSKPIKNSGKGEQVNLELRLLLSNLGGFTNIM